MTEDQQTYKRATTAALAGLGVQLFVGVVVAVLAVWAQSAALAAAMWYVFGGWLVWGTLWLVYNQHRLERLEALEAEQLAAETGSGSMFDEAGHDLALARKRLEKFYRWGLSAVSLVLAFYLLAMGGTMLWRFAETITPATGGDPADFSGLYAVALANPRASVLALMLTAGALALVGFLMARYVAGMTQVKQWTLLRGGATYLMGNVVVLVGVVAASVLQLVDNPVGFAVLTLVIPAGMVVLGLEIVLSFVFGAYRPRQPGEVVRPAFDSRLLGWLTQPESLGKIVAETLNYQFGFEISRSWFYQLLGKAIVPLILLGAAVLVGLSCVVIVPPQQEALVTTMGRLPDDPAAAVRKPGISFKLPWPFATAQRFDVSRVQTMRVGSLANAPRTGTAMLWTNKHIEGKERYLVTAAARGADRETSGYSAGLCGGELVLQWRIKDLLAYTSSQAAAKPEVLLRAIAEGYLAQFVAGRDIDVLLTTARLQQNHDFKAAIQQRVDAAKLGIEIDYAGLYGIHPPQDSEVAASFLKVVNALIQQRTTVANAERERVGTLSEVAGSVDRAMEIDRAIRELESQPRDADGRAGRAAEVQRLIDQAGGAAAQVLSQARADRWKLALGEQARAKSFGYELDAFRRAPGYFKARWYLDTLAEALPGARKIITTTDSTQAPIIRLNLKDESSGLDSFISGE